LAEGYGERPVIGFRRMIASGGRRSAMSMPRTLPRADDQRI
jgi:hypothetical protein